MHLQEESALRELEEWITGVMPFLSLSKVGLCSIHRGGLSAAVKPKAVFKGHK